MNNVRSWREWFDWEKWGEETRSIDCYDYILSSLKSLRQKRAPICGGRSHATVLLSSLVRSFSKARLYSLNKKYTEKNIIAVKNVPPRQKNICVQEKYFLKFYANLNLDLVEENICED